MPRDDALVFLRAILITAILVCGSAALAADAPEIDCAAIRAKVAEHGKSAALAWAIAQGYRWRDISRIRRKCGM